VSVTPGAFCANAGKLKTLAHRTSDNFSKLRIKFLPIVFAIA
jgi:hypothetical protein